jgi:hypothetical protein
MRGAYSRYRAHSAFERGYVGTDRIIKICMLAFPSIWVSCMTVSDLPFAERRFT